jgi:hypothetical protein
MMIQYQKGRDWSLPVIATMNFVRRLFVKTEKTQPRGRKQYAQYGSSTQSRKAKSQSSTVGAPSYSKQANQETIDRILDKIAVVGYEKLSKEEKQILFQASQRNDD